MGDVTDISWADKTFNGWKGCVKKSAACRFCYAERDTRRWGMDVWGAKKPRIITSESTWKKPLTWNRKAEDTGEKVRVFAFSWADVFERHPDVVDARQRFFDLVERTPALTWMLCTKRPENVAEFAERWAAGWPPNVWLGTTAETQRFADERLPVVAEIPAVVRFVSAEPLLGPVDLTPYLGTLQWVITGGESGREPGIRPSHPDWFRAVRDQAVAAGVAYHHKQNGEWVARDQVPPDVATDRFQGHDWHRRPKRHLMLARTGARKPVGDWDGTEDLGGEWAHLYRMGRKPAGRLLDGKVWAQFPDELELAA
jgi:protein gp37